LQDDDGRPLVAGSVKISDELDAEWYSTTRSYVDTPIATVRLYGLVIVDQSIGESGIPSVDVKTNGVG